MIRAAIPLFVALALVVIAGSGAPRAAPQRLLYVTHSAGYRHDVLPVSHAVVRGLGRSSGAFEVTVAEDAAVISESGLRDYDAVFFYTSGELPLTGAQKRALLEFVRGGKAFIGAHSAADTFYRWPEYGEMIGAYFDGHPWHTRVGIRVEDADHPATRHLPARFEIADEIYQFRNWSRDRVHVLLSLDPASVDLSVAGVNRADRDFALAWTRRYGKGRVFYTALGHSGEVWGDERFTRHLLGGILWAMGRADGGSGVESGADESWRSLFDGETAAGWRAYRGTTEGYDNFELELEWKVPPR